MMISSCFINQWKVGSPFRIFQWRHQQIPLQNPTPLDWSTCSISWASLATGILTVGSWLAQLMRLQRRKSRLQPSWTTCHLWWTTQYHNAAESTYWKMFVFDLENHQLKSLTISAALADWYSFLTEEEKEQNVQYRFIRALSDKELIKRWLALDSSNTQDAWSVLHTHHHLRQPRGHGIEGTKDSQCHMEAKPTLPREETPSRQCALMWTLYEVPPT